MAMINALATMLNTMSQNTSVLIALLPLAPAGMATEGRCSGKTKKGEEEEEESSDAAG